MGFTVKLNSKTKTGDKAMKLKNTANGITTDVNWEILEMLKSRGKFLVQAINNDGINIASIFTKPDEWNDDIVSFYDGSESDAELFRNLSNQIRWGNADSINLIQFLLLIQANSDELINKIDFLGLNQPSSVHIQKNGFVFKVRFNY